MVNFAQDALAAESAWLTAQQRSPAGHRRLLHTRRIRPLNLVAEKQAN